MLVLQFGWLQATCGHISIYIHLQKKYFVEHQGAILHVFGLAFLPLQLFLWASHFLLGLPLPSWILRMPLCPCACFNTYILALVYVFLTIHTCFLGHLNSFLLGRNLFVDCCRPYSFVVSRVSLSVNAFAAKIYKNNNYDQCTVVDTAFLLYLLSGLVQADQVALAFFLMH